jgi:hypothetical protein
MKSASVAFLLLATLSISACSVSRGYCESVYVTERERCLKANEDSRSKVEARKKKQDRASEDAALGATGKELESRDDKWTP